MKRIEVAAAVIEDPEGRIFATQRGYGEWKDWWEFPGGKIEAGETPQEALRREIHEELDAEIEVGELLRTIEYDYPAFHLTMHCFRCQIKGQRTKYKGRRLHPSGTRSGTVARSERPADRPMAAGRRRYNKRTDAMNHYEIISERQEKVLRYLEEHAIPFTTYNHPEGKTIEEAKRWWHDDGSVHCKNIFMRNHKGNQHYLICFPCDDDLAIHDIEHWLKDILVSQGKKAPGKLSFASPERMMRYLGLEPGSVSPFGLINDTEHHVILFLDSRLKDASSLSFHPNDCRGTVVISQEAFQQYLAYVGNTVEYINTQSKQ